MSITDLDELVLKCRGANAKTYLHEAVSCYRAAAYRACVVATWIAVVYDVIDKLRELALSGDATARQVIADVDSWQPLVDRGDANAIKKSLDFERNVITLADQSFGFFEPNQVIDLERLRADRNRCAHPTYQRHDLPYQPSAELARLHLRSAVEYLLSQPPVLGKAAVEQLIRAVGSAYFPREPDKAKPPLQQAGLSRPKDSLVTAFVDALLYGFFERAPELKRRPEALAALNATIDMFPGLALPRLRRAGPKLCRDVGDADVVWFFLMLRYVPQLWDLLEQDNRTRLEEFIRRADAATAVSAIATALDMNDLRIVAEEKVRTLTVADVGSLLTWTRHPTVLGRAVDLYCAVRNWGAANEAYEGCIRPAINNLSDDHLRRILNAPVQEGADLPGSHGFREFFTLTRASGRVADEVQAALGRWPFLQ